MQTRRTLCLCTVLAAGIALAGCATSINDAQGRREALYELGTLKTTLPAPIERVYEAARATLKELNLRVLDARQDGIAAELVSRDAQGQQVCIRLEAMPDSKTQLHISIGVFGDKNKSMVLLRHVKASLVAPHDGLRAQKTPSAAERDKSRTTRRVQSARKAQLASEEET